MLLIQTGAMKKAVSILILLAIVAATSCDVLGQNINTPNNNGPLGTQVNTLSGNLFVPRTDIFIPARGINMDLTFNYNSFNYDQNRGYGNGWNFNYGMRYYIDTTGAITIFRGDGREDIYSPASGGTFTAPQGIFDLLSQYQTGKYLLKTKSGMQYFFDNNTHKRLTKILEPNGNYLNLTYTDSLVTSITNAAGQTITLAYAAGFLTSVTDALASPARTWSYKYDGYGNLINVTDPLGNSIKYKYLVNGPMSETTDKNGNSANIIYLPDFSVSELISCNSRKSFSYDTTANVTTVTDYVPTGSNQVTTYNYKTYKDLAWLTHISGNCCGYNMTFEFDNYGNMVKYTDAKGNIYIYTYDNKGNLLTVTDPLNRISTYIYSADYNKVTSYTDPNGNIYSISYDSKGNALKFTEPGNIISTAVYSATGDMVSWTDGKGNTYNYTYDAYGNLTQLTSPLSTSLKTVFDERGNLTSFSDPKGNSYTAQHDLLNRLTVLTDPLNHSLSVMYDAQGNITSMINENGQKNQFSYDASNRVTGINDAKGFSHQYSYDAMNNLVNYKDPLGYNINYKYDNQNRLTAIVDPGGNVYAFNYDENGNRTSISYPNGNTITNTYNQVNQRTGSSDASGTLGSVTYDKNDNVSSYTNGTGATISASYDGLNRLTQITDPLGHVIKYSYDNNNKLVSVTDRNNNTSSYVYDDLDRPTSYTDNNNNVTAFTYDAAGNVLTVKDANSNVTAYTYDALNRLKTTTYPDGKFLQFGYDNRGNILSKQLTDGSVISFQYDLLNQLVAKNLPGNIIYSYTYDAKGRLETAANSTGTVRFTYDARNRIISESFLGHTTSYTYDISKRTSGILYPDSTNVIRSYDVRNRLSGITRNNTSLATFQYNNANQIGQVSYGNGVSTNYTYDFANRLNNLSTSTGSIQNRTFTYNNEIDKTSVSKANLLQSSEQYIYDANNRLIGFKKGAISGNVISSPDLQNSYTYDDAGNRTSVNINGVNTSYRVNNLNQYTSLANGSQTVNFTYDGNGNLSYDGSYYKKYDAEGKLISDSASGSKLEYQYDALGRRVQKLSNGSATNYYYSGLSQLEQRDAINDTLLNEVVYSGAFTPLMGVNKHQHFYYHENELNSVEAITNEQGNLLERYEYDPYGKASVYDSTGNVLTGSKTGNRFGFTGQEYDSSTNTYHFHFRNYSPATGRFNERDPIGYGDDVNIYQYVHDNPANLIDLLGLEPCPPTNNNTNPNHANPTFETPNSSPDFGNPTGAVGEVSNDASTAVTSLNYLGLTKYSGILTGTASTLGSAGLGVFAAATSTADLALTYKTNTAAQNTDLSTGIVMNLDGAAIGVGIASGVIEAPAAVGVGVGLATYGLVNSASKVLTGKSAPEHLYPISDKIGNIIGNEQATSDYNAIVGYHMMNGDLDKWIAAQQKIEQRQRDRDNGILPTPVPSPPSPSVPCPPNGNNGGTQKRNPPGNGKPGPGGTGSTEVINSHDPNEIIGPTGVGTPQWVSVNDRLPYTILFENSTTASAPAKVVKVTYPIDAKQDMSSFSLGSFGFNNLTFSIPPNTPSYYQRLNAVDSLGLYVDVTAGLDVTKNQIFWTFQSIDPVTQLPPTDPLKGFLKLRDTSDLTAGHGFVNFTIKPLSSDNTGDTIHATASILFDLNDTVPTNVAKNTIDAVAPVSHINSIPATTTSNTVALSWSGQDDVPGSGLKSYTLYLSVNNGSYGILQSGITRTDTTFTGAFNNTYSFFVLATDSAGNMEALRPGSEVTILMSNGTLPITWLFFNASLSGKDGLLKWATAAEINTKEFEIERSVDGRNFTQIGTTAAAGSSASQSNYSYTDLNVTALNIPVVYYRLKQTDKDGKSTYSNIAALQLPTTSDGPIVRAYPNPFKQSLTLMIANAATVGKNDKVEVYSLEGKMVYQRKISNRSISAAVTLDDLPQLTPGMYILRLDLNNQKFSFKVIKQ